MRAIRRPVVLRPTMDVGRPVRDFEVGAGLPDPDELSEELEGYIDVLMGRVEPPINAGVLTLMEVADAYYARACEIEQSILKLEREGNVFRGSKYYKFRTGELRSFLSLSKKASELGSRRLTHQRLLHDMVKDEEGLDYYNGG